MSTVPSILEGAKKTLDNANKFTHSVTQGKPNMFAPKAPTAYSHVREARKAPGEFMGMKSDQAPEINTALENREQAKKALEQ